jgi:hypothetical protein
VTDDGTPPLSATNNFAVVVQPIHNGPVLPTQTNRTIVGLATLVVTNTAGDNDFPATLLTYVLALGPTDAVIDTNGVISWTSVVAQVPSTNTFTTVVTDDGTPPLSATNSFAVVVQPIHNGPVLPPQTNRTIVGLETLVVTNTAGDNDIPATLLTYVLALGPTNAVIDTNGVISWTPVVAQVPSTNIFTTVVTDNGTPALSATNSFNVFVEPPPMIESVSLTNGSVVLSWNAVAGRTYRLQYKADLSDTNWTELSPNIVATGPTAASTNLVGSATQGFYRVLVLP